MAAAGIAVLFYWAWRALFVEGISACGGYFCLATVRLSRCTGVILRLNGNITSVPERILITDINPTNEVMESRAISCYSELPSHSKPGEWYLNERRVRATKDPRGWEVDKEIISGRQLATLRRVSDSAMEGEFTCHMGGDINPFAYVGIYYPSELKLNV